MQFVLSFDVPKLHWNCPEWENDSKIERNLVWVCSETALEPLWMEKRLEIERKLVWICSETALEALWMGKWLEIER